MIKKYLIFSLMVLLLTGLSGTTFAANTSYDKYMNAAWKARQVKQFTKARKYYIYAAKLKRKSSAAVVGLLYTYIESENFLKAESLVVKLLKRYSANIWVRKGAAWTFYKRKRYDDAITQYSYLIKKYPDDNDMKLGLGLSLYFSGRTEEAKKICSECRDYFGNSDERIILCMETNEPRWFLSPGVYLSYTDYSDSFSKGHSKSITSGLEVYHATGFGLYLQGGALEYSQKNTDKKYHQSTFNAAVFYSGPELNLWVNQTRLGGDFKGEEPSYIYTMAISKKAGRFHFGFEGSKGYYKAFETNQYKPEIGFYMGEFIFIKAGFVTQKNYTEDPLPLIELKTRHSAEISIRANFKPLSFSLSGYYGERWYTVENKGLNIWNANEEFEWGSKMDINYKLKNISPYLSVRVDKTIKQFGLINDFYTTGITTGLTIAF